MAFSVEYRVPFLDHRLVEWVFTLAPTYKIRQGRLKWILRESLKDLLPDEVYNRHDKNGFNTPGEFWLHDELKEPFEETLTSQVFKERGLYDYRYVAHIKRQFELGDNRHALTLWRIFALERWCQSYFGRSNRKTQQEETSLAA